MDPTVVRWRLHLSSPPEVVYAMLATDEGRARFWAESAVERDGVIRFVAPGDVRWESEILEASPPTRFSVRYFGGTIATFVLAAGGAGGTDLTLIDEELPQGWYRDVLPGWVSVLLALKAAADFGVDLRNHDPARTWDKGYADN